MAGTKDESMSSIIDFIKRQRGKYRFAIRRETRLVEDLDIYGDDAEEFLEAFSQEFGVDISHFPYSRYFPGERPVWFFLYVKLLGQPTGKKCITVGDLVDAVHFGRIANN